MASNESIDESNLTAECDVTEGLWSCSRCLFFNQATNTVCKNCQLNRLNVLVPAVGDVTPPWLKMPERWHTPIPGIKCLKRLLHDKHPEYLSVMDKVNNTDRHYGSVRQIVKIYRLENPTLFSLYQLKKLQMDEDNGPDVENERILYHGTTLKAVDIISNRGFNRSHAGKNATVFGRGVYFARDFGYSATSMFSPADQCAIKRVLQCRVLTGFYTAGGSSNNSMIEPPFRDKSRHIRFDSTVDRTKFPGIFVVYHDAAAYPEYLITFRGTGGEFA